MELESRRHCAFELAFEVLLAGRHQGFGGSVELLCGAHAPRGRSRRHPNRFRPLRSIIRHLFSTIFATLPNVNHLRTWLTLPLVESLDVPPDLGRDGRRILLPHLKSLRLPVIMGEETHGAEELSFLEDEFHEDDNYDFRRREAKALNHKSVEALHRCVQTRKEHGFAIPELAMESPYDGFSRRDQRLMSELGVKELEA